MTLEEFKQIFKNQTVPKELIALYNFQYKDNNLYRYPFYADFHLDNTFTWFNENKQIEKELNDSIIAFAGSDGSGGYYAFWLQKDNKDLSETPIIHIDSEGGADLICKNILDLLTIMTSDFYEGVYDPSMYEEPSEFNNAYKIWIKNTFNIKIINPEISKLKAYETISEVKNINDEVQKIYGEQWKQWKPNFFHDY